MSTRKPYDTDMTDAEWAVLAPLVPAPVEGYRPVSHERREIVNAILYQQRTGCQWRLLPHDFPPWSTVKNYYYQWAHAGIWKRIHDALRTKVRETQQRDPHPSVGIIDSQSVKTTEAGGERGFDAGKKVKGRKRHLLVDTLGLIIVVLVTGAGVQDRDGGKRLLSEVGKSEPRLRTLYVDAAYNGRFLPDAKRRGYFVITSVKQEGQKGFVPQSQRWVVERTFGWLNRDRRLSKDYERTTWSSQARIHLSMIRLMTKRLTGTATVLRKQNVGDGGDPATAETADTG